MTYMIGWEAHPLNGTKGFVNADYTTSKFLTAQATGDFWYASYDGIVDSMYLVTNGSWQIYANSISISESLFTSTLNSGDTQAFWSLLLSGNDTLIGSLYDDVIGNVGTNAGNDSVYGGEGNDQIYGGLGDDFLDGGNGNDKLFGGDGNDRLFGGTGSDQMTGGKGNDVYVVDSTKDRVVEAKDQGADTIETSLLTFDMRPFGDVENLSLVFTPEVYNGVFDFTATGNNLNNVITSGWGNDHLNGKGGDDIIIGGAGNDVLIGGVGNDHFVFNAAALSGQTGLPSHEFGNDVISDFNSGLGIGDVVEIDLSWGFATASEVIAALVKVGSDSVLIIDGHNSITFSGLADAKFALDDFVIL